MSGDRTASARVSLVLAALFMFTLAGCSTHNDSLPALGTEEDYLARRENTTYPFGCVLSDPSAAYDPYCFSPYWSYTPIYYFSRGDGDLDCDDGSCRSPDKGFHHKQSVGSPPGFSATAGPRRLAHFGPLFVAGGLTGRGRR